METQLMTQGSYVMTLHTEKQSYKVGDEVFISYGRKPNWSLLYSYGFLIENNKHDYFPIFITELVTLGSPKNSYKLDLIKAVFSLDNPEKFKVKVHKHTLCYKLIMLCKIECSNCDHYIDDIRAIKSLSFELQAIEAASKALRQNKISIENRLSDILKANNELAIMLAKELLGILSSQIYLLQYAHSVVSSMNSHSTLLGALGLNSISDIAKKEMKSLIAKLNTYQKKVLHIYE